MPEAQASSRRFNALAKLIFPAVLVLLSIAVYFPSLNGWFLFDDFPNLSPLIHLRDQFSWGGLLDYTLEGVSSKLGRPLALLTFGLQADYWFRDAFPFKAINLFIHCLNGLLVYAIAYQIFLLQKLSSSKWFSASLACLAALIWLLHPINVSSVAYVVQRMALLSSFFVLSAVYMYIVVVGRFNDLAFYLEHRRKLIPCSMLLFALMLLGVLSKENAALLPLGLLALQLSLLPKVSHLKAFRTVVIYVPLILGFIGFVIIFNKMVWEAYSYRDFTLYERLLTQTRMLAQYLLIYVVPTSSNLPFFNDHIVKSSELLRPLTTVFALGFWSLVLLVSIAKFKRWRFFSFGVFWFLAFHALESSVFPLELYYEHRNYLPAIGLTIALMGMFAKLALFLTRKKFGLARACILLAVSFWLGVVSFSCYEQASLWGRPLVQSYYWYEQNPKSIRAADHYGNSLLNAGKFGEAEQVFKHMEVISSSPVGSLHRLMLACAWDQATKPDLDELLLRLTIHGDPKRVINYIGYLSDAIARGSCKQLEIDDLLAVTAKLKLEERYASRPMLFKYESVLLGEKGEWQSALESINKAVLLGPSAPHLFDIELDRVNVWIALGHFDKVDLVVNYLVENENILTTRQLVRLGKIREVVRQIKANE